MYPYPENPDDWQKPDPGFADCSFGIPTDQLIAEAVAASVLGDPHIRGGYLDIQVQNSVVILLGSVMSEEARTTFRSLAWAVPGVHDVCSRLVVAADDDRAGVDPKHDDWL